MKCSWKSGCMAVGLFTLLATSAVHSETTLGVIPLNGTAHQNTFSLIAGNPAQLSNEFMVPLHHTTIVMEPNLRLGVIKTIGPGQTVDLEFSREGRYSICFSFSPEEMVRPSGCVHLEVLPRRMT